MYDSCELDGQCFDISARAICSKNQICICQYGYYDNSWTCIHQEEAERSKAQQVYRTAMIAAACFMILVVSIFVICIVKKSFCGNTTRSAIPGWQFRSGNETQGRASANEEEITVADKPPSYEEVMLTPCTPPPNYTDILKLFPITEGLQRHNSEPRLSAMAELGSSRNRANSFHTCENSVLPSNDTESTNQQPITPPPKYEPPSGRSRPSLHLDIPVITVSFSPEIEDAPLNNENTTQSHGRYS